MGLFLFVVALYHMHSSLVLGHNYTLFFLVYSKAIINANFELFLLVLILRYWIHCPCILATLLIFRSPWSLRSRDRGEGCWNR